jgi:predicted O-methyltransferase YrrM
MKFADAARVLEDVPHIHPKNAERLYDFVFESGARDILELGFAHGASTAYMAAALDERGEGRIVTMDLELAKQRQPSLVETLERTGLTKYVEPVYSAVTYTWELMQVVEDQTQGGVCQPCFDFAFIDGAHTWEADGLAFFLVDKLLRVGGWMLFDDLQWSFDDFSMRGDPFAERMPPDMRSTPQVAKIVDLLVSQHPGYGDLRVDGNWGWAHKVSDLATRGAAASSDVLDRVYGSSIRRDTELLARKIARRVLRRG